MKNKKLLALNIGLGLVVILGGVELKQQIDEADDRYRILNPSWPPKEAPGFQVPQAPSKVRQADHMPMPIVERLLFSKDRNPVVEVEPPPPPEAVQRPPLPLLVGVMELGGGPVALMAPDAQTPAGPVEVGEKIGEFVFVATAGDNITLDWNGEKIEAHHSELRGGGENPKAQTRRRGPGAGPKSAPVRTSARPKTKKPSGLGGKYNIGQEIRPGVYAADPKDTSPAGTTNKGLTKRVRQTPFGRTSWWEKR